MCFPNKDIAEASDMEDRTLTIANMCCGVKMAIVVILIRVNLIIYPISCINCPSYCIRFNTSSEILLVVAEGFNPSLNKSLSIMSFRAY